MCVYNILDQHNIPCSVVSGYFRPPIFMLQSQARVDQTQQQWLPHLWVEVDGFDDPVIDIYSIGGSIFEFCQFHGIQPDDQVAFQNKARELGCKDPASVYKQYIVSNGKPTAAKVLGNVWRSHEHSQLSEYCLTVPQGDECIESFGIPKHKMDEFAEHPGWPNGAYFQKCSPGVKKLFTQIIADPLEEEHDNVDFVETVMKPAGELVKSQNLIRYDAFLRENLKFLQSVHTLPEHELLQHKSILDEYSRLSESLTSEDKALMQMIGNRKKAEREEAESKIKQEAEEKMKRAAQELSKEPMQVREQKARELAEKQQEVREQQQEVQEKQQEEVQEKQQEEVQEKQQEEVQEVSSSEAKVEDGAESESTETESESTEKTGKPKKQFGFRRNVR